MRGRVERAVGFAAVLLALSPVAPLAQSLNDATTAQLQKSDVPPELNKPCGLLLGTDSPNVLDGALQQFCARGTNPAISPSSNGGGAATPASRPATVEARLRKEEEEDLESVRGFFLTIGEDSVDRQASAFEDGYNSDVLTIAAGFDKTFGGSWIGGIAFDMSDQEGDLTDGGDFEVKNVGITGYGSRLIGESAALDFYFGFAQLSNDRQRRASYSEIALDPDGDPGPTISIEGTPTAEFDADQMLAGIQFAHDWTRGNITFGPRFGFDWRTTSYDTYSEVDDSGLALTFYDDEETSAQLFAGLVGSLVLSTDFGVVVLHESLAYRYETDQDQRDVTVSFVDDVRPSPRLFTYQTEGPDRDFLEVSLGTTFIRRNGLQILVEYSAITSHQFMSSDAFVVGFRKEL